MKVLGYKGILEQMEQGAYIYRVSGKFGGWGISDTTCKDLVTVRADSCRKVAISGKVYESRRSSNYVEYRLKNEERM